MGLDVYIGVPEKQVETLSLLKESGFHEHFKVMRMYYGTKLQDKGCVFAVESLERG